MDYEGLLELVQKRRSTRSFKPDPIPDDAVNKIIEAARWAPSGFNLQPWEFVVVRKEELRKRLLQYVSDGFDSFWRMEHAREAWQGPKPPEGFSPPLGFTQAPVFIIPFVDTRTRVGLPMIHRYSEESWQKTYISTIASAYLYMHLAAAALGLGSQWVSIVCQPEVHCNIKRLLGIPDFMKIYDMFVLGYPTTTPPPRVVRSREEIVHYDDCGEEDFRTDEEVKAFIYSIRNPKASPVRS